MSVEKVKDYFEQFGMRDQVLEFEHSSATVDDAAIAVGCTPGEIAKTISLLINGEAILIVTAGDVKIDNKKYKDTFKTKAKMIPWDDVEGYIGHAPGGVCPFAINEGIKVYLDESLKKYEIVYPACGSGNSAIKLSISELETYSNCDGWVDVCKMK